MCTVTFIPKRKNSTEFIFTSNRDEASNRPSIPPKVYRENGVELLYPKDKVAGGTWIAASSQKKLICLMNGARKAHERNEPYRKSRGVVLKDLLTSANFKNAVDDYEFEGIEPFTLVIANKQKHTLHQFRWDEKHAVLVEKESAQPHIWSSATLYDEETRKQRVVWFDAWLKDNKEFTVDNILHFHHFGGTGNIQNDLVMDRDGRVQTVSITSVEYQGENPVLYYEDIVNQKLYTTPLST